MISLLQPTILRFDSIDSTNLEAMRQAKTGAPEGLCIVAREQTRGRGRQGRRWVSAKDAGLNFTLLLRPRIEMSAWPLITLMTSLAVADTFERTCGLSVDIKWPNDLLADQLKLSGILCETVDTEGGYALVVGIGINLYRGSYPAEASETATSVEQVTGRKPDFEVVLNELMQTISRRYAALQTGKGTIETIREWCARSSYARGKHVRVESGAEVWEGVTAGLQNDGALRVEVASGEIRVVRAGDVRSIRPHAEPSMNGESRDAR